MSATGIPSVPCFRMGAFWALKTSNHEFPPWSTTPGGVRSGNTFRPDSARGQITAGYI
jgi:hypothetical protein